MRRAIPDVIAACLIALAVHLAFGGHGFLNYDSFYALVWGDDLASGRTPDYEVPVAPTPHPLLIWIGALLSPLGDASEGVVLALVLLGMGALTVGLFRLGQELYAWPVGLLAAAIVITRVPILNFGVRGYVDLPTIALIVWAAVLEARQPKRGAPVLILLALAGLLRPEAWLFAAAYWLWLAPPLPNAERAKLAVLAAAAPFLWALMDLLVTGDPLHSLNGTSDLAAELNRRTGLDDVPGVVPFRLGEILRLPELVAAVAGFALGLRFFRDRTMLPTAVAALNGVAFLVFAVAGLPLLGRYLFLSATMLALFAALAALGWTALGPSDKARERWRAGGAGLLVLLAMAFAIDLSGRLNDLRNEIADRDRVADDLHELVDTPEAKRAFERCGTVYVPNHRPVPNIAYWTDTRPRDVVSAQLERPSPDGLFVEPANEEVKKLSILDKNDPKRLDAKRPGAYTLVAENRSWRLFAGCSP